MGSGGVLASLAGKPKGALMHTTMDTVAWKPQRCIKNVLHSCISIIYEQDEQVEEALGIGLSGGLYHRA